MNRRHFLQTSPALVGAGLALTTPTPSLGAAETTPPPRVPAPAPANLTIRDYLCREAVTITDRALRDFPDRRAWEQAIPRKRQQYLAMLGLDDLPPREERKPPSVHLTGTVERPAYRIEKLAYESLPGLYVTANLYVPKNLSAPAPGVVYVCGHAQEQKVHYQAHPRRFAELGFVCLIVETVQLGEVTGHHHGCYREGWFQWYSRGYSPAAVETLNGIRALDLLQARAEVDPRHLGVTGISGGGATSWWLPAADERVGAAAPVCGTATLASHIADRTIDDHCDCMWWINTERWDLADVGALIAPRPLLIGSANRDALFTIASIREVHRQLAGLYDRLGAADQLRLIETPGGHSYHERSRTGIFSWFIKHLQGRDVPPEQVGDIDDSPAKQESAETLRVYVNGGPAENRCAQIPDSWPAVAEPPSVPDAAALKRERERIVAALRRTSFAAFPQDPPPLAPRIEYEFEDGATRGFVFSFTSEAGWRLRGRATRAQTVSPTAPAVLGLCVPDEDRYATRNLLGRIRAPWVKIEIATRGTGDTAWGQELQWHLRRASAWTGRTLASMRVWDTLRALAAVRQLPGKSPSSASLAARGEMAAVGLYAALLDGHVERVLLEAPPATQNAPSQPDGKGPALEMLSCLRVTDLPQVAGLLWPAGLVVAGEVPSTYEWAEQLYARLGGPGRLHRVKELSSWQPE